MNSTPQTFYPPQSAPIESTTGVPPWVDPELAPSVGVTSPRPTPSTDAPWKQTVMGVRTLIVALVAVGCVGFVGWLAKPEGAPLPPEVAQGAFLALATIASGVSLRSGLGQLGRGWSGPG